MSDCVFCDIVNGKAKATLVWQDDLVSAFLDIQPINAGHIDIVPNAHAAYLADLPADTGAHMFGVAQRLAQALLAHLGERGPEGGVDPHHLTVGAHLRAEQ